jgi:hypothetical protein
MDHLGLSRADLRHGSAGVSICSPMRFLDQEPHGDAAVLREWLAKAGRFVKVPHKNAVVETVEAPASFQTS